MRAIHFNEATRAFSSYLVEHPLQCLVWAIGSVAFLVLFSGASPEAREPRWSAAETTEAVHATEAADAEADETPEWVWGKRVRRGGGLYPTAP